VLVEGDLVYHSFDFEDVPLVAVTDVDLGTLQVRVGHRIHCEFVRLLLEVVAVFECVEDTIARGDVGELGEDLLNECWIEMRIDRRCAGGVLFVVDEIHIGRDEFAVVGIRQLPTGAAERFADGDGSGRGRGWENRDRIH